MTDRVPRTCTEIRDDHHTGASERPVGDSIDWRGLLGGHESGAGPDESQTLDDYRESDAYVLLGAPGAGKTTEFKHQAVHAGGRYVTARDFLTFDERPERRDTTLFIDGLDEMRAGSPDGRTPLDGIRRRLDALGRPRFRLSCRDADWFGDNDRTHLEMVSGDGRVTVLRLDPLSDDGIHEILDHYPEVANSGEFIAAARERGIDSLLANPQSLRMLVYAVAGDAWPATRTETFELACEKLVRESNSEHRVANRDDSPASELLDAAGRVCALQLICGLEGAALTDAAADEDFPAPMRFGADAAALHRVLPSRLFERAEHGRRVPIHRNVAEFLAARHIARLVGGGNLSVRRVLALLTREDGGVVAPLRGLSAWLAVHCPAARAVLIEHDPEGVSFYGDASVFSPAEKRDLMERLRATHAFLLMGCRFRALATPDMAPLLRDWITENTSGHGFGNFANFLLFVLANESPFPELRDVFLDLVMDEDRPLETRRKAGICLAKGALIRPDKFRDVLRRLLCGLRDGSVRDDDGSIMGPLLNRLYPGFIGPDEVFDYLCAEHDDSRRINAILDGYQHFWQSDLPHATRPEDAAVVLDKLVDIVERSEEWKLKGKLPAWIPRSTVDALVEMAFERADEEDARRTLRWLQLAGADDDVDSEVSRAIREWVEAGSDRYKELLREAATQCSEMTDIDDCIRRAKDSLRGAAVPPDYGTWCLGEIERARCSPALAGFWFEEAWYALEHDRGADGLTLEHLEAVAASDARLGEIHDRLRFSDFSDWWSTETRRWYQALADWRRELRRHEKALRQNRCPAGVLNMIGEAYWGHYIDIQAATGRERLRRLLGDDTLLEAAVTGLRGTLHRNDLPAPAEVLSLRGRDRRHALALPVLAGLDLDSPDEPSGLDPDRVRTAFAFLLAERESFPEPSWLKSFVKTNPGLAADEIVRFATIQLRRSKHHAPFVHEMCTSEWLSDVARDVCPRLLRAFPVRAPRPLLDTLNRLLWGGLANADASTMETIVARKLAARSMTRAQRAHWLAAQLVISPHPDLDLVEGFAGKHENAMAGLFSFFEHTLPLRLLLDRMPSRSLGRLARLLGRVVVP